MRPDPEMMLACDCQGSLGIGLEVAQGSFAVVGRRQKVLAARCRFELIVRRRVLEFRKWICRGHRNSRAPPYPAPMLKSLTLLHGNRKRAGALRQQCPLWVKSGQLAVQSACLLYTRKRTSGAELETSAKGQYRTFERALYSTKLPWRPACRFRYEASRNRSVL